MKKLLLSLLLEFLLISSWAYGADTSLGLVLDIQGKASIRTLAGASPAIPVSIMTYLPSDSEIVLDSGSKLTVTHYKQKNQQSFVGPARLVIKADGINVAEGTAGKVISLAEAPLALARKGLETHQRQAALVMRAVGTKIEMSPANRTAIISETPKFSWTPFDGDPTLRIFLFDDLGDELLSAEVTGNFYQLPLANALKKGNEYNWAIIRKDSSVGPSTRKMKFKVLTDEQISLLDEHRPNAGSSFSDRLLYAGILDELWLKKEAQKQWVALLNERPDDPFLKKMIEKNY